MMKSREVFKEMFIFVIYYKNSFISEYGVQPPCTIEIKNSFAYVSILTFKI